MVNQSAKFIPNSADIICPLTQLLSTKRTWQWGTPQDKAFSKIKCLLTESTALNLYDTSAATKYQQMRLPMGLDLFYYNLTTSNGNQ